MRNSRPHLLNSDFPALTRDALHTLQLNLGYTCNQSCQHCHVNAGPNRTEQMSRNTLDDILTFAQQHKIKKLDLTGGAPELNPHFRDLVKQARELGMDVIDRCNLTILNEDGFEDMAQFLADHQVEIVASLPCYSQENVDKQRGKGVFDSSIVALKKLNQLGYGKPGNQQQLNLMYNPGGAYLPPAQASLEADYKQQLKHDFDIEFTHLYTLTNMPIMRFGGMLLSTGEFDNYMNLLKSSHSHNNLHTVMCKNLISIDWQGYVYDCDFNQMLDIPSKLAQPVKTYIADLDMQALMKSQIQVADHCYGCTAGSGSSCGGALS